MFQKLQNAVLQNGHAVEAASADLAARLSALADPRIGRCVSEARGPARAHADRRVRRRFGRRSAYPTEFYEGATREIETVFHRSEARRKGFMVNTICLHRHTSSQTYLGALILICICVAVNLSGCVTSDKPSTLSPDHPAAFSENGESWTKEKLTLCFRQCDAFEFKRVYEGAGVGQISKLELIDVILSADPNEGLGLIGNYVAISGYADVKYLAARLTQDCKAFERRDKYLRRLGYAWAKINRRQAADLHIIYNSHESWKNNFRCAEQGVEAKVIERYVLFGIDALTLIDDRDLSEYIRGECQAQAGGCTSNCGEYSYYAWLNRWVVARNYHTSSDKVKVLRQWIIGETGKKNYFNLATLEEGPLLITLAGPVRGGNGTSRSINFVVARALTDHPTAYAPIYYAMPTKIDGDLSQDNMRLFRILPHAAAAQACVFQNSVNICNRKSTMPDGKGIVSRIELLKQQLAVTPNSQYDTVLQEYESAYRHMKELTGRENRENCVATFARELTRITEEEYRFVNIPFDNGEE